MDWGGGGEHSEGKGQLERKLGGEKQQVSPHGQPGVQVCRDDAEFIWGRVEFRVVEGYPGRCSGWQGLSAEEHSWRRDLGAISVGACSGKVGREETPEGGMWEVAARRAP